MYIDHHQSGQAQACATLLQDGRECVLIALALDAGIMLAQAWTTVDTTLLAPRDKAWALDDLLADGTEHHRRFARICLGYGDMLD